MAFIDSINFAGASLEENGSCRFSVWAPLKNEMLLHLPDVKRKVPMAKRDDGFFVVVVADIAPGTNYYFITEDGRSYPDPASNYQPDGVHGPSRVVDQNAFKWTDQLWRGIARTKLVLYEIHVGTFTDEGTFEAVIPRLTELLELGINAIELMPVAQFPGTRNWGYDGVYPYAVQNSYGGVEGLKKLVDACHEHGIAVILDVVYNHLGPEGNYLKQYGPYFTDTYRTPWGDAVNYDGAWSDGVREYFCNNALFWFHYYHVDGLRLDAVHMVFDNGAVHFWQYLNDEVARLQQESGRPLHLIAESDLNSPKVVKDPAVGGYGFSAQWLDDFHHALYVILDKNGKERYEDFGRMEQLAKAWKDGFVHSGEYVKFRKRKHGYPSVGIPGSKFVVFTSNHDQIGNRPDAERLPLLINYDRLKLAAAALILSPYIPMLFMGEEYGEEAPFYYFISHSDAELIEAVRKGRREEFKDYKTKGEPPDPQDEKIFNASKLRWHERDKGHHRILLNWHVKLIKLRKELAAFGNSDKNDIDVSVIGQSGLAVHRQEQGGKGHLLCLFNFDEDPLGYVVPFFSSEWEKVLDAGEPEWTEKKSRSHPMVATLMAGERVTLPPLNVSVYRGVVHGAVEASPYGVQA